MPNKKFALGATLMRGSTIWAVLYIVEASSSNEAKGAVMTKVQEIESGAAIASIAVGEISLSENKQYAVTVTTKQTNTIQSLLFIVQASSADEAKGTVMTKVQEIESGAAIASIAVGEIK